MEALTGAAGETVTSVCHSGDISNTVVTAVARAKGVDVLDLDPLYDAVDPDALNRLFDADGPDRSNALELSFSMAGCDVLVRGEGEVVVTPPEPADGPTVIGDREQ